MGCFMLISTNYFCTSFVVFHSLPPELLFFFPLDSNRRGNVNNPPCSTERFPLSKHVAVYSDKASHLHVSSPAQLLIRSGSAGCANPCSDTPLGPSRDEEGSEGRVGRKRGVPARMSSTYRGGGARPWLQLGAGARSRPFSTCGADSARTAQSGHPPGASAGLPPPPSAGAGGMTPRPPLPRSLRPQSFL